MEGGEFVSLLDPPDPLQAIAAACHNEGAFPVGQKDVVGPQSDVKELSLLVIESAGRSDAVVGYIVEGYVFSGTCGEVVDGLKYLVCHAVPFERSVKRNDGILAKCGRNAIAIERRARESSCVNAVRQLPDASLALQTMQHIKDGTAVRVPAIAIAGHFQREERRGLSELCERNMNVHDILT